MNLCRCLTLLLLGLTGFAIQAGETVYKWVDAEGQVHFGDKPESAAAETVTVKSRAGTDSGAEARRERVQRILDDYATERAERDTERAKVAQAAADRARQCAEARDKQFEYEHASHLYTRDATGTKHILNDEDHMKALDAAREAVAEWCR